MLARLSWETLSLAFKAFFLAISEAKIASPEKGASHNKTKLAFKGRAKIVVSPYETTLSDEAILTSPIAKKKALKAKPRASQPKVANIQFFWVSVLDRLDPGNTDLRDYLSNKRKIRSEKPVHISPSWLVSKTAYTIPHLHIYLILNSVNNTSLARF